MTKGIIQDITQAVKAVITQHYPAVAADHDAYAVRDIDQQYAKGTLYTHTVLLFGLVKALKQSPAVLGEEIGSALCTTHSEWIKSCAVQGPYLNLELTMACWGRVLTEEAAALPNRQAGEQVAKGDAVVLIEYASPNTNKPLHLGHLRNIFIGDALSNLYAISPDVGTGATNVSVRRVNLINDRGIHICKSMLAYDEEGQRETPTSASVGDALVGKYYVRFEQRHREQVQARLAAGLSTAEAEETEIMERARALLRSWEAGDAEVVALWRKMNAWAEAGMASTYERLGVVFDCVYKESDLYTAGKKMVLEGLERGICYQKADGSIWIDLTDVPNAGLDHKLLLRSDGTSVYITQDLGVVAQRYADWGFWRSYYVVGDEQNYHFQVLFAILGKFGLPYADRVVHIGYGMVDLPDGKMKSREGTVVEADGLLDDLEHLVQEKTDMLGKVSDLPEEERAALYRTLAVGAIKYHILRIRPAKRMLFDYQAALDLQGDTSIFIQYSYARICALLRRAGAEGVVITGVDFTDTALLCRSEDSGLLAWIDRYAGVLSEARSTQDPSMVAHYLYQVAKAYNRWYTVSPIFDAAAVVCRYRVLVSARIAGVLRSGLSVLGIGVVERM